MRLERSTEKEGDLMRWKKVLSIFTGLPVMLTVGIGLWLGGWFLPWPLCC